MKFFTLHMLLLAMALILSTMASCAKVDDLDDQSPVLIVEIVPTGGVAISDTQPVYLIYYTRDDWTNPWMQHGSSTPTIINPVVLSETVYIAAYWDENGNGVVDAGEACTGYENADHTVLDSLTKLTFYPLEWRQITIALDDTVGPFY